jgi:hypothetical protein
MLRTNKITVTLQIKLASLRNTVKQCRQNRFISEGLLATVY